MSEKRYFRVEYDEEWYLFDSATISEQLVEEQAEYGYGVFANSLSPSEVVDLLNEQLSIIHRDEISIQTMMTNMEKLEKENEQLRIELLDVCAVLNNQQVIIEELQQKYDKLCIEMANIYSKYIFMKEFSKDTNPNEAVKHVLRELMQKTKEAR